MDIIEEAKKANALKVAADKAAKAAADHAAWTMRKNHCIAWFKTNVGLMVEPYGTDYHGVLCRTDEGLHFAWRECDRRLAGSPGYGTFTDGPAASLLYRTVNTITVKNGPHTGEERVIEQLIQPSLGTNHYRVFYDLAGLGASLERAETEVGSKKGAELIWSDE